MGWLSYGIGVAGLIILGWALIVSGGLGPQIPHIISDILRRDDPAHAREETKDLSEKVGGIHNAIALSWLAFLLFFALHHLKSVGTFD